MQATRWTSPPPLRSDSCGEFVNTLDPQIELIDPDGSSVASDDDSASDGRNAQLRYAAEQTGTYLVRSQEPNRRRRVRADGIRIHGITVVRR